MSRSVNHFYILLVLITGLITSPLWAVDSGLYSIGTPASAEEIAGWDIDIRPDGKGLPAGSGSGEEGERM